MTQLKSDWNCPPGSREASENRISTRGMAAWSRELAVEVVRSDRSLNRRKGVQGRMRSRMSPTFGLSNRKKDSGAEHGETRSSALKNN